MASMTQSAFKALQREITLFDEWQAAHEQLDRCLEELASARSQGNAARYESCKKWAIEAHEHEQNAYFRLWKWLTKEQKGVTV